MWIARASVRTHLAVLCVVFCVSVRAAAQDNLPPLPAPAESGDDAPPSSPPPPVPTTAPPPDSAAPVTPPAEVAPPAAEEPGNPWSPGFYLRMSGGIGGTGLRATGNYYGSAPTAGLGAWASLDLGGSAAEGFSIAAFFDLEDYGLNYDWGTIVGVGLGVGFDWHPALASGWHVGGKIGFGAMSMDTHPGNSSSISGGGDVMGALTGGYDWRLSRHWGIGVVLRAAYYSPVDFPVGNTVSVLNDGTMTQTPLDLRLSAFNYSLGFTAVY